MVFKGDNALRTLYLTFDDGPQVKETTAILDLLQENKIAATFFCLGCHIQSYPQLAQRILDDGHLLANHSFNHMGFGALSLRERIREIEETNQVISQFTGVDTSLFRAPQGNWRMSTLMYMYRKGITGVHWSYDSEDYRDNTAQELIARFENIPPVAGDILLFHDDNLKCTEALSYLIPKWKEQGFTFNHLGQYMRNNK